MIVWFFESIGTAPQAVVEVWGRDSRHRLEAWTSGTPTDLQITRFMESVAMRKLNELERPQFHG